MTRDRTGTKDPCSHRMRALGRRQKSCHDDGIRFKMTEKIHLNRILMTVRTPFMETLWALLSNGY